MVALNVGASTNSVKQMNFMLIGAFIAITFWVISAFVRPLGSGIVHILLVLGVILFTSWILTKRPRT
jgi:hypothetical protein